MHLFVCVRIYSFCVPLTHTKVCVCLCDGMDSGLLHLGAECGSAVCPGPQPCKALWGFCTVAPQCVVSRADRLGQLAVD